MKTIKVIYPGDKVKLLVVSASYTQENFIEGKVLQVRKFPDGKVKFLVSIHEQTYLCSAVFYPGSEADLRVIEFEPLEGPTAKHMDKVVQKLGFIPKHKPTLLKRFLKVLFGLKD